MFEQRRLLIVTKHGKEKCLAPLLEAALGLNCQLDQKLDTDLLGTFSGEVERQLDPLSNAREKCRRAMALNQADLALATEGSFGPHPALYLLPAHEEFILLRDHQNDLEIAHRELSTATNFSAGWVEDEAALFAFAAAAGFPEHALILRPAREAMQPIFKGLQSREALLEAFGALRKKQKAVWVETDMRAHYNPSRMAIIEKAGRALIAKIQSRCPQCACPGFGPTQSIPGLPCAQCGSPTRSIMRERYQCQRCPYYEERAAAHGKTAEDPGYCDYCNP